MIKLSSKMVAPSGCDLRTSPLSFSYLPPRLVLPYLPLPLRCLIFPHLLPTGTFPGSDRLHQRRRGAGVGPRGGAAGGVGGMERIGGSLPDGVLYVKRLGGRRVRPRQRPAHCVEASGRETALPFGTGSCRGDKRAGRGDPLRQGRSKCRALKLDIGGLRGALRRGERVGGLHSRWGGLDDFARLAEARLSRRCWGSKGRVYK